jgi:hypothetical protein
MKQVEIYSIDGRLVQSLSVNGSECLIEGLESGVYMVRIGTDEGSVVRKMVKM